ncbi:MAG: phage head-tail connector protein [Dehalobacter sp.]|nr:phage head-tail connector protein [Dehalobacter sp.]
MTQLEKLKIKLGIALADSAKDDLLNLYLTDAEELIIELSHMDAVPTSLSAVQVDLAIIAFNKQGIEGQTAHSEGGISRTFEDIPESMLKKIRSCRRLPR